MMYVQQHELSLELWWVDGHLRGADVMRKYAVECGVKYPQAPRGTHLRKHVA